METWKETEGAKYGIAIYNFDGNVAHGLELDIGDAVQIFESCAGWYRGCCLKNKTVKGIFPASFIMLKECIVENLGTPLEIIIPSEDPVVKEVAAVLREWLELWKGHFVRNQHSKLLEMKNIMNHLIDVRQKILSGALTQELIVELKREITSKIDFWNSQMELDLVPRVNGEAVDVDQVGVVELYKIHLQSLKQSKKLEREVTMPRSSLSIVRAHRHILLSVKRFICNVEDNLEVFFSLFNGGSGKFLSERFLIRLNKDVVPDVAETLGATKTKTLFTDLGRKSFASDVIIVCQVVRTGQMHSEQSPKKKSHVNFRRPFACGVFSVQENLFLDDDYFGGDRTFSVPLYPCNNDADFHNFHEVLIRKLPNKFSTSSADGMSMEVSLKVFNGDREKVIKANPLWIPLDISITRKLGFPEIILPGDLRNDVYITLDRGEFEKGGKTSGKNIEVCMSVLMSNGAMLQDCIHPGSGCYATNEYQSLIFYHNNFPKWNETIKLNIPTEKFQDCHVLFMFKHCPTTTGLSNVRDKPGKVFAFAFLRPLRPDGTTIVDGSHQLVMYKTNLLDSKNPGKYLSYPSFVSDLSWVENQHNINNSLRNTKEVFFVTTLTCSTKLTKNLDLVGLLKWRQQKVKITDVLMSLLKVPGDEIVKFLQDILDALFSILNEDTEKSGMLVFQDLIFIINLLLENKYQQFQAVLNSYIKHHFSAALAHRYIVALFIQVMLENNGKDASGILKVAKALQFIIKFIMQSWALYIRTHPEQSNLEFKQSIRQLFVRLNEAMERKGNGWHGVQSAVLSGLPKVYGELSTVFKDDELADMLQDLFCSARSSSLIVEKLNFLDGIITTSALFQNATSRVTLMPLLLNCLHQQLLRKNELKTCADLLGNLLSCLSKTICGSVCNEVDQISKALLQVVFQAVLTVDRSSSRAGQYVAILFALLKMMSEDHYHSYLKSFDNKKDLRDFLNKAFGVFTNLLQRDIYPDDWFAMKIEGNYVILGAVQNFSLAVTENFLHEDAFDYQLWNTYFHLAISFVSHGILNLDKYSEAKRLKILEKYGDMRHVMGFEIVKMWNSLGDLQSNFIPSMIASFLEMTLLPEPVLRKETLPIFYDMMEREMNNNGNIDKVEEEFINKLDVFVSRDGMGDDNYKELFREILTEKIKQNSSLIESGLPFVNSVIQLLERLLDYRKVISSREENRDMELSCIVNLMNYYEEKGKEDMYSRYVEKLYNLHLAAENYCEAGFALYLYASGLEFGDTQLKAEGSFPAQTEGERKETLYKRAIDLLDKGKLWESGIRLCKKLINLYESETFDFIKLSEMLRTQARFYRNIIGTYRPEPAYFRVGFFGKGFPTFLQNRQFVYRGKPLEKIGEFCSRIENEYPDAEVLRHNNSLEEELLQSPKQYIQCCQVKPVADNRIVPDSASSRISSYYKANWVNKFRFSRPFHKGQIKDKSNEFATLWCEVITLTTETCLPGILPWFPVVRSESMELSPIENAVNTVTSKTRELEQILQDLQDNDSISINPLSMILNGIIDAAVNGGIVNYRKAFFTPDYTRTNPLRISEVNRLENALHEQASVLRRGLILHDKRISQALRPLHENLLNHFNNMVNDLPGETHGYILIQRKSSLPISPSPSQNSSSSTDRRISALEGDTGTLHKKLKLWLSGGRKALSSSFDQDEESSRRSISSAGMRQSTSLMSFSEPGVSVSQSMSVPDLRLVDESSPRPKLPPKLRPNKLLTEDTGSPASPALSRTSYASSASASIASLTEIDELDELEFTRPNSLMDGYHRTSSPQPTCNPVLPQDHVIPPLVPPKKRMSISSKPVDSNYPGSNFAEMKKKRQSNFFELSSDGFLRVSKAPMKHSKSVDDLDKIAHEGPNFSVPDGNSGSKNSIDSGSFVGDKKPTVVDTAKDNSIHQDDETPPPLMPRKSRSKIYPEEPYDTLTPTSRTPYRSPYRKNSRDCDPLSIARFGSFGSPKPELSMRMKHYYANLDRSTPLPPKAKDYTGLGCEEEPYDTLVLPNNQATSKTLEREYLKKLPSSREDVYDFLTTTPSGSSNNFRPGLEASHPNSSTIYDTVVLRDRTPVANGENLSRLSQHNYGETVSRNGNRPGDDSSKAHDRDIDQRHPTSTSESTSLHQTTVDLNTNSSDVPSRAPPPTLPPKTFRKDFNESSPKAQLPIDSQAQSSPKPVRKKPPPLLPKPRKL